MLHGEDTRRMRRHPTRLTFVAPILDLIQTHPGTGGTRSARPASTGDRRRRRVESRLRRLVLHP
jgi:hypothetical protein